VLEIVTEIGMEQTRCFNVPCFTMLRNRQSPSHSGTTYANITILITNSITFQHTGTLL